MYITKISYRQDPTRRWFAMCRAVAWSVAWHGDELRLWNVGVSTLVPDDDNGDDDHGHDWQFRRNVASAIVALVLLHQYECSGGIQHPHRHKTVAMDRKDCAIMVRLASRIIGRSIHQRQEDDGGRRRQ